VLQDAPTWTEQLTAWATLGTAAVAVIALMFAARAARAAIRTNDQQALQLEQLKLEAAERRQQAIREQASLVCVWITDKLDVWLTNASTQPIYDVTVTYSRSMDGVHQSWAKSIVAPNTIGTRLDVLTQAVSRSLTDSVARANGLEYSDYDLGHVTAVGDQIRAESERAKHVWASEGVEIEFRDVSGRRWRRDPEGVLRLTGPDRTGGGAARNQGATTADRNDQHPAPDSWT